MKKLFLIALCAMLCFGSASAQQIDSDEVAPTEIVDSTPQKPARKHVPEYVKQEDESVKAQLEALSQKLNQLLLSQEDTVKIPEDIYVPIKGKNKFTRRNHIYQTLDVSPTISTDKNTELPESTSNGKEIDEDQLDSPTVFVPGRIENDQLKLNRMGFAYNVGLVASFSRQEKYGTTCNFLLKTGIETGNGHMMGIGFDLLGGYGKSTGDTYLIVYDKNTDEDDLASPYTEWCWQYGAQLWMRCNFLQPVMKNTEMLVFARCVKSKRPGDLNDTEFVSDTWSYDNYWKDESWSFGIIIRYKF